MNEIRNHFNTNKILTIPGCIFAFIGAILSGMLAVQAISTIIPSISFDTETEMWLGPLFIAISIGLFTSKRWALIISIICLGYSLKLDFKELLIFIARSRKERLDIYDYYSPIIRFYFVMILIQLCITVLLITQWKKCKWR